MSTVISPGRELYAIFLLNIPFIYSLFHKRNYFLNIYIYKDKDRGVEKGQMEDRRK